MRDANGETQRKSETGIREDLCEEVTFNLNPDELEEQRGER